ncbi:MAG: type III pantothenate kinase [Calditrichota bacterium]
MAHRDQKQDMILTVDVGNTQIEVGIFEDQKLKKSWRMATGIDRTEDEYMVLIQHFLSLDGISIRNVTGVAISSVVPNITFIFEKMCNKYLGIMPIIVDHKLKLGIKIRYSDPSTVGADRICNAVAAYQKFNNAVVIIDFGTATTFDIINSKAEYLGGIIAPGIETTAWALYQRAAKLPKISLEFPQHVIGKTTMESMQSGIMLGSVKMIDGLVEEIIDELGEKPNIISTGGLSRLIQPRTKYIESYYPHLVLEGLYKIYNLNKN